MKKFKIILIVILILVVLYLAFFLHNFIKIQNVLNTAKENNNNAESVSYSIESYENKNSDNKHTVKVLQKDSRLLEQYVDQGGYYIWQNLSTGEEIYYNTDNNEANEKQKTEYENVSLNIPSIDSEYLGDFNKFTYSLTHWVSNEEVSDKECIKLSTNEGDFWIEKDTGYIVKIENNDFVQEYKNIEINTVTDEEIAKPELSNFTIVE